MTDGILQIEPVAYIRTDFADKFGLPRQSGLIPALKGEIVFQPQYSQPDAVRELDAFSHIWLIWGFHAAEKQAGKGWSATVRPPRLGGNVRVGVFASRAPFRPNGLGMSCVRLEAVHTDAQPVRLTVSGIDLLDGTPIYDIKPYIPVADCKPDASEGYTALTRQHAEKQQAALAVLAQDPRPGYADDPERIYGVMFAGYDIRFRAADGILTVCAVRPSNIKGE